MAKYLHIYVSDKIPKKFWMFHGCCPYALGVCEDVFPSVVTTVYDGTPVKPGPPLAAALSWILQPVQGRISTAIRPIIRQNPGTDTFRPHIEVYPHLLSDLLFSN